MIVDTDPEACVFIEALVHEKHIISRYVGMFNDIVNHSKMLKGGSYKLKEYHFFKFKFNNK